MIGGLDYAALGWRLHPCRPRTKFPLLEGWPEVATSDPATVAQWEREFPTCNWAVACGPASGVFVLDLDGPEGEAALAALERRHGLLPDHYPMQWTGSGEGWQAFFAYPVARDIRNRKLGPKIETRGDGGYVILPPSIHPSGRKYRWADDRGIFDIDPPGAPAWLLDLIDPPSVPEPPRPAWADRSTPARGSAYALKALRSELALTAVAVDGRRNVQLNTSAFALFRLCAEGDLDVDIVARGLFDAARHAGLEERAIRATLASAARARGVAL